MSGTKGTSGAPAANNSGSNNNNQGVTVFTTPVKAKARVSRGTVTVGSSQPAPQAQSSLSQSSSGSGGGTSSVTGTDPKPGDAIELQDIPFAATGTKPIVKPTSVVERAHWDGTVWAGGNNRMALARACLRFWKELAFAAMDASWTEQLTWWYAKTYGTSGELARMAEECRNMTDLKKWLERRFLSDVTVAELTAPMYRVQQRGMPMEEYAAEGRRIWRDVCDLIPHQEETSVQVWVSQIDPQWAKINQSVLAELNQCAAWEQVLDVVARWRLAINEPTRPGGAEFTVPAATTAKTAGAGAGEGTVGAKVSRTGPGCWICGSTEHRKRQCPSRPDRAKAQEARDQGKGKGRSE